MRLLEMELRPQAPEEFLTDGNWALEASFEEKIGEGREVR